VNFRACYQCYGLLKQNPKHDKDREVPSVSIDWLEVWGCNDLSMGVIMTIQTQNEMNDSIT